MNELDRFEMIGELYAKRFCRLRPGKDDPIRSSSEPENVQQFKEWMDNGQAFEDAIEALIRTREDGETRIDELEAELDRVHVEIEHWKQQLARTRQEFEFLRGQLDREKP